MSHDMVDESAVLISPTVREELVQLLILLNTEPREIVIERFDGFVSGFNVILSMPNAGGLLPLLMWLKYTRHLLDSDDLKPAIHEISHALRRGSVKGPPSLKDPVAPRVDHQAIDVEQKASTTVAGNALRTEEFARTPAAYEKAHRKTERKEADCAAEEKSIPDQVTPSTVNVLIEKHALKMPQALAPTMRGKDMKVALAANKDKATIKSVKVALELLEAKVNRLKVGKGRKESFLANSPELPKEEAETRRVRLRNLIKLGKERGFLTYAVVNDHLPDDLVDAEQIESIITTFGDMGIQVYDHAPMCLEQEIFTALSREPNPGSETRRMRLRKFINLGILRNLLKLGLERGFLTYAELNDHLPDDLVDAEQAKILHALVERITVRVDGITIKWHEQGLNKLLRDTLAPEQALEAA